MRPNTPPGLARLPIGRRRGLWLALGLLGLASSWGCARDRQQITPTTLGTDLKRMPRGQMKPYPWPGQSIAQAKPRPGSPTTDSEAALASGARPLGQE
jgi:hypothetical protein